MRISYAFLTLAARGGTHRGSSRRDFRPGREAETPLYRAYCQFRRQSPGRKDQARWREGFHHGLLGLLASTLACTSTSETTYVDVGRACVSGAADEPHSVEVDFHVCLSSSCDTVVESMCEATLSGTELTIDATATVSSSGNTCTLDCQPVLVTCETDPLPAGDYELIFGDLQTTLTVPAATAEPTCLGEE